MKPDKNIFFTRTLLYGGLAFMMLLFFSGGIVSFMAMKNSTAAIIDKIESLDSARKMQIEFQKQFYNINKMTNLKYMQIEFKEKYHRFSYHHSAIKDVIGNLKIAYIENPVIVKKLSELNLAYDRVYAESVSDFFLSDNRSRVKQSFLTRDFPLYDRVLNLSDEIAVIIEEDAENGLIIINKRYSTGLAVSLSVFGILSGLLGLLLSYRLEKITNSLEAAVKKRTNDLKIEADLHKKTAVDLQNALSETNAAKTQIEVSEKKYRHFVEDSGDLIFVLNHEFIFINANKAASKHLNLRQTDLAGLCFFDLIREEGHFTGEKEVVQARMRTFINKLDSIQFKTSLMSSRMIEPVEMNISFEKIQNGEKLEILGKASKKDDEILLRFFQSESCEYEIGSKLLSADDVSNKIIVNLVKFMSVQEANNIRIGLRELIVNAIEHGNLNISFDEKSKAIEDGDYIRFLSQKGKQAGFRHKRVQISYSINREALKCVISDSGSGFDHRKIMLKNPSEINNALLGHGRGILMAKNIFDSVTYNEKGNVVTVEKRFNKL